jgi:hypothetical protein
MFLTASSTDLVQACQILFSPEKSCSLSFLQSLDPSTLKIAYRKKALETHPDRARVLGVEEDDQSQRFRQVKMAYEALLPVTENRMVTDRDDTESTTRSTFTQNGKRSYRCSSYHQGSIPNHPLKFGHFLYYSGMISWQQLIAAVMFQRRLKPRYGEIALSWNMISLDELAWVLKNRERGELIGEYFRRSGYLSGFQHLAIMGKQRQHHCLFGEYFINEGILSQRQLDIALIQVMNHNRGIG